MAETIKTRLDPTPPEDGKKPTKKESKNKFIAGITAIGVGVVAAGVLGFNLTNDDKEAPLGSGPVAEAPAEPGSGENNTGTTVDIDPATLEALKAISVEQAEINSGTTVEELSEGLDPYNTELIQYLISSGSDPDSFKYGDPMWNQLEIILNAYQMDDYGKLQDLVNHVELTPEDTLQVNNFYTANQVEIMKRLSEYQNSGDVIKTDLFKLGSAGQIASSIVSEAFVNGRIYPPRLDNATQDTRLRDALKSGLSAESFNEYGDVDFDKVSVLIIDENGNIDTSGELDLKKMNTTLLQGITKGTILVFKSSRVSGFNKSTVFDEDYELFGIGNS